MDNQYKEPKLHDCPLCGLPEAVAFRGVVAEALQIQTIGIATQCVCCNVTDAMLGKMQSRTASTAGSQSIPELPEEASPFEDHADSLQGAWPSLELPPKMLSSPTAKYSSPEVEDSVRHEFLQTSPVTYVSSNEGESMPPISEENSFTSSEKSHCPRKDDFMKLWYCREEPHFPGNTPPIVLVVGFFTDLQAQMKIAPGGTLEWTKHVKFVVEPQLPQGLCLNEATGGVSGIPLKVQETASTHNISAIIHAYAPGGISIGKVTLGSCNFVVRVVDGRGYQICWTEETTEGLALKLKKFTE
jgi:hypothetical protein